MEGRASGAPLRSAPSPSQRKHRGVGWCLVGAKLARASLRQRNGGQGQACAQGSRWAVGIRRAIRAVAGFGLGLGKWAIRAVACFGYWLRSSPMPTPQTALILPFPSLAYATNRPNTRLSAHRSHCAIPCPPLRWLSLANLAPKRTSPSAL